MLPYRVRLIQLYTVAHIAGSIPPTSPRDPIMENAKSLLEKILPDLITGIQEEIYRKTVKNGISQKETTKYFTILYVWVPPPPNPLGSRAAGPAQDFPPPMRVY